MTSPPYKNAIAVNILLLLLCAGSAMADAIMRSEAMFADTIAEYFVEEDHVRLELEIGSSDVAAFRNLLPDALYERLGYGATPLQERLARFVSEDMPVLAGDTAVVGRVANIGPGTRPLRDRITGEVLPTPEDEATVVIRATILFPFMRNMMIH